MYTKIDGIILKYILDKNIPLGECKNVWELVDKIKKEAINKNKDYKALVLKLLSY